MIGSRRESEMEAGTIVAERYRLNRIIGDGGMGVVWAATHLPSGKDVAVKHLRVEAMSDLKVRKRFVREAKASLSLSHPNVVAVHELLETSDGIPVIVMDLLEGEPLRALLARDKKLSVEDTARILLPAISAVGTAHAQGIVHRDLKPENIFLARSPSNPEETTTKLLDFGIAKLIQTGGDLSTASVITGTWSLLGTPYYMAPEQAIGEKDIDHRADIWALGVILYECLAGIRPAEGKTAGKIFEIILLGGIKKISALAPELPKEIADAVDQMLSREREDRPKSLHEILKILSPYTGIRVPDFGAPLEMESQGPASAPASERAPADSTPITLDFSSPAKPVSSSAPDSAKDSRPVPSAPITLPSPTLASAEHRAPSPPRDTAPSPKIPKFSLRTAALLLAVTLLGISIGFLLSSSGPSPVPPSALSSGQVSETTALPGDNSKKCPAPMIFIKAGSFFMGSSDGRPDERPVHRVDIRAFCMDPQEVRASDYAACVAQGQCPSEPFAIQAPNLNKTQIDFETSLCIGNKSDQNEHPIHCVNWNQANAYCQSLKKRLPSEEEWEYAARGGGEQRRYPWGIEPPLPDRANVCGPACIALLTQGGLIGADGAAPANSTTEDGFVQTAPAGRFPKGNSREGARDLIGNVWEWTRSSYCAYPDHTCSNPSKVLRGAGWMSASPDDFRASARRAANPSESRADYGFRCAAALE